MLETDRLLYVLTARGRIALSNLRALSTELDPSRGTTGGDQFRTYRLARYLDMLGHAEFLQTAKPPLLATTPPALARLPDLARHRYVLCGSRSAATVEEIRQLITRGGKTGRISGSSRRFFPDDLIPDRVCIDFDDPREAQELAKETGMQVSAGPAGWALANFSGGCSDFEGSLAWRPRTLRDSELRFYLPERRAFVPEGHAGQGLAQRTDDPSWLCIVRDDEEAFVRDLDWGRYWAHAEAGTSVLRFDSARRLLATPSRLPLPRLLARALVLCSGLPPAVNRLSLGFPSEEWLVYRQVPKEVAFKVADKLASSLVPKPMPELEELS